MLALIALLALAFGVVACGDSDDSDSGGDGAAAAQGESNGEGDAAAATPEGQVRVAYDDYIETFYKEDSAGVCDRTSQKGQRMWAEKGETCETSLTNFFNSEIKLSRNRPFIVSVRLDGSRAVARAKTKRSDIYAVPMVKDAGQWKVDTGGGP